ncbi:MAG: DUF5818 domain-containing protein [Tsuneonella suprasediminis]
MGPVLERASVPVGPDLHLRGELVDGPLGLVLQAGGGHWELDAPRSARRLVGREVEVTGHRAGFNGLICKQVWPACAPPDGEQDRHAHHAAHADHRH